MSILILYDCDDKFQIVFLLKLYIIHKYYINAITHKKIYDIMKRTEKGYTEQC